MNFILAYCFCVGVSKELAVLYNYETALLPLSYSTVLCHMPPLSMLELLLIRDTRKKCLDFLLFSCHSSYSPFVLSLQKMWLTGLLT